MGSRGVSAPELDVCRRGYLELDLAAGAARKTSPEKRTERSRAKIQGSVFTSPNLQGQRASEAQRTLEGVTVGLFKYTQSRSSYSFRLL